MSKQIRLTRSGRHAFKAGVYDNSPDELLAMEVMTRLKGPVDYDNFVAMFVELKRRFGSAENAIVAVKSGTVTFIKCRGRAKLP